MQILVSASEEEREGLRASGVGDGDEAGSGGVAEIHAETVGEGDGELVDAVGGQLEVAGEENGLDGGGWCGNEGGERGDVGASGGGVASVPFGGVGVIRRK